MRPFLIILFCCLILGAANAQEELSPYDTALQRIEEARETGADFLDLSYLGLTEVPPEIGSLQNLRRLFIAHNDELTSLPPEIGNLINLTYAEMPRNHLMSLPPEIGNLSNLGTLILSFNQLSILPAEIGNLSAMGSLWLDNNQLQALPPEIGNLQELCFLNISNNQLRTLPTELAEIKSLEYIDPIDGVCNFGMDPQTSIWLEGNPFDTPLSEMSYVPGIFNYLRNEAWWHFQRLVIGAVLPIGIIVIFLLSLRLRGEKAKRKRGNE